jgi:hypothetical protein
MRLMGWYPLTQYGQGWPFAAREFRDRPDLEAGETYMSLILGNVDALAASVLVRTYFVKDAARRQTTVGNLRKEGFRVEYSPEDGHPLHVSVYAPGDGEWDGDAADRFSACFTDIQGAREEVASDDLT